MDVNELESFDWEKVYRKRSNNDRKKGLRITENHPSGKDKRNVERKGKTYIHLKLL